MGRDNSDWKTESSGNDSPGPSKPRRKKLIKVSRKKRRHEETTVNWNGNNTRTLIGAIKRDKVSSKKAHFLSTVIRIYCMISRRFWIRKLAVVK